MATSVISNTVTDPSGTAVGSVLVTARLMPTGGFRTAALTEVARVVSTTSNGSGAWTLTLERNADITPANTTYEVTEYIPDASGGKRVWNITVGSSNQSVLAALTSVLTAAQGSSFLTQASADARYQALSAIGTDTPGTIEPDDAASAGVSTAASRGDHQHAIVAAAAVATGDANAEGVATSFARSDHVHKGVVANEAWTDWTPTWTNLTVGSSTVVAKFMRVGRKITWRMTVTLSGATVGDVRFTLPVTTAGDYFSSSTLGHVGAGTLTDANGQTWNAQCRLATTTQVRLVWWNTSANAAVISSTAPFTWANTDGWDIGGTYEAAA